MGLLVTLSNLWNSPSWKGHKNNTVLTLLILIRVYLTLVPSSDIAITLLNAQFYFRLNDIINIQVGLWFSINSIRSLKLLYHLHKWKPLTTLLRPKFVLMSAILIAYDGWLIWFIYSVWTSNYAFVVQMFEVIPALTLFVHSNYQFYFLVTEQIEEARHQVDIEHCIGFNSSMIVHLISTLYLDITFQTPGIFHNGRILSIFKFIYHLLAIRKFQKLKHDFEVKTKEKCSYLGVKVLDSVDMDFNRNTKSIEWVGYGLKITTKESIEFNIHVDIVQLTDICLPEGTELISPLYYFKADEIKHPVEVEMQHCGIIKPNESIDEKEFDEFCFVFTKDNEPPYRFEKADKRLYSCDFRSSIGTMTTTSFSFWAVAKKTKKSLHNLRHLARLYYSSSKGLPTQLTLVIAQNTEATKTQLAQNFHSNFLRGPEHEKVIFASNSITIKILKNQSINNILYDGLTIDEEWKITPNIFPLEVEECDIQPLNWKEIRLELSQKSNSTTQNPTFPNNVSLYLSGSQSPNDFPLRIKYPNNYDKERPPNPQLNENPRRNYRILVLVTSVGFIIGILLTMIAFYIYPVQILPGLPESSPTNKFIDSSEEIINDFPCIDQPHDLCLCLDLSYTQYKQISKEYPSLRRQTIELIHMWYNRLVSPPKWDNIVDILLCAGYCQEGSQLAKRKGVDLQRLLHKYPKTCQHPNKL